jgi:hypothetical protein
VRTPDAEGAKSKNAIFDHENLALRSTLGLRFRG